MRKVEPENFETLMSSLGGTEEGREKKVTERESEGGRVEKVRNGLRGTDRDSEGQRQVERATHPDGERQRQRERRANRIIKE